MTARLRPTTVLWAVIVAVVVLPGGAFGAGTFPGLNGRIVYVHREPGTHHGQIFSMDPSGANPTQLTFSVADDYQPSFSGDGTRIVFARDSTGFGGIWVMNANGSGQTPLTSGTMNAKDYGPAFSPDGGRIAFQRYTNGQSQIWTMNSDGTGKAQLTSGASDGWAAFSPNGDKIAFAHQAPGGHSEIWVMNADGTAKKRLVAGSVSFRSYGPAWSPDGQRIAFEGVDDPVPGGSGLHHIWTMNADGSALQQITTGSNQDQAPVFSPDGTRIAFEREGGLVSNIFLVDPDGQNLLPLTHNSIAGSYFFDEDPDWQSLPDTVAPETEITKQPPDKTEKSSVKFKFSSDEPGSTFECKLTGMGLKDQVKTFNPCSSPRKYKNLDPGKYRFTVRATDLAGNVDPTPATDVFKVVD